MNLVLLLGAGFSRNWGGPLASEMYGRIIGRNQIRERPELRQVLQSYLYRGGFEAALGQLQDEHYRQGSTESLARLEKFQAAIAEVFSDFDEALSSRPDFEFQTDPRYMLRTFMSRFDAIFSLNQDLLLERFYLNDNIALSSNGRWFGWQMPGVRELPNQHAGIRDVGKSRWTPVPASQFEIARNLQPIYKLHGSTNWYDEQTKQIMVLGYNKTTAIQSQEILRRYHTEFSAALSKPDTRLVVIGYGFADNHINNEIRNRISARNLRMFIIDPLGVDVTDLSRNAAIRPYNDFLEIIDGVSIRQLRETFGGDISEHMNLTRFIDG